MSRHYRHARSQRVVDCHAYQSECECDTKLRVRDYGKLDENEFIEFMNHTLETGMFLRANTHLNAIRITVSKHVQSIIVVPFKPMIRRPRAGAYHVSLHWPNHINLD